MKVAMAIGQPQPRVRRRCAGPPCRSLRSAQVQAGAERLRGPCLPNTCALAPGKVFEILELVLSGLAAEPRKAVLDIGGVAGFRHLAVNHDRDSGLNLPGNDIGGGLLDRSIEIRFVHRPPLSRPQTRDRARLSGRGRLPTMGGEKTGLGHRLGLLLGSAQVCRRLPASVVEIFRIVAIGEMAARAIRFMAAGAAAQYRARAASTFTGAYGRVPCSPARGSTGTGRWFQDFAAEGRVARTRIRPVYGARDKSSRNRHRQSSRFGVLCAHQLVPICAHGLARMVIAISPAAAIARVAVEIDCLVARHQTGQGAPRHHHDRA